jgi:hypothetical protein
MIRVVWEGDGAKQPWRTRRADELFADPHGRVLLLNALRRNDPTGRWWQSSRGALERPATIYEVMHAETPPREGWTIVDGALRVAELKQQPKMKSELDEEEEAAFVAKAQAKLERNFERVREKVAKHSREAARHTTLAEKWMGRLRALERHRVAKDRT